MNQLYIPNWEFNKDRQEYIDIEKHDKAIVGIWSIGV